MPIGNQTELTKPANRAIVLRELLTSRDTFATTLLVLVIDTYGPEAMEWSPQTLAMEIHDDFQVDLPQSNIDKIMAAIQLLTTNDFYQRLPMFNYLCNVLSGDPFDPSIFEPATAEEIAWAVVEAALLFPPEADESFTPEILAFIRKVLESDGVFTVPTVLGFARSDAQEDPINHLTEDPEMYQAFYANQQQHSTEIDRLVQGQLQELVKQLETLPLRNGNTAELVSRLKQDFSA